MNLVEKCYQHSHKWNVTLSLVPFKPKRYMPLSCINDWKIKHKTKIDFFYHRKGGERRSPQTRTVRLTAGTRKFAGKVLVQYWNRTQMATPERPSHIHSTPTRSGQVDGCSSADFRLNISQSMHFCLGWKANKPQTGKLETVARKSATDNDNDDGTRIAVINKVESERSRKNKMERTIRPLR